MLIYKHSCYFSFHEIYTLLERRITKLLKGNTIASMRIH
jgi:hypothetical protein